MVWLEGYERVLIMNRLGVRRPQLGRSHRKPVTKIVLHTTEGSSAAGAFGAYRVRAGRLVGGIHPHLTVHPVSRQRFQHVPLDSASYALKRFDRDGVIQIEIVGFARETHTWPVSQLRWLGTHVIAPIVAHSPGIAAGGRIEFPPFLGESDGLLAAPHPRGRARLSAAEFQTRTGIVGHQHATFDDHWDPGRLDVGVIVNAALHRRGAHPADLEEDEDMYLAKDTTENRVWIVAGGKARELAKPDEFDFDGPVRSAANMRHIVKDLFEVAPAGPGVEDPPV